MNKEQKKRKKQQEEDAELDIYIKNELKKLKEEEKQQQ